MTQTAEEVIKRESLRVMRRIGIQNLSQHENVQTYHRCIKQQRVINLNVRFPEIPHGTDLTDRQLTNQWNSIDWASVKKTVRNLQSRIARAAKESNCFHFGHIF